MKELIQMLNECAKKLMKDDDIDDVFVEKMCSRGRWVGL